MNEVLHVFAGVDGLEDVLEGSRDDAPLRCRIGDALHRERLAAASLASTCQNFIFSPRVTRLGDSLQIGLLLEAHFDFLKG